jgi:hypothetical protein
MEVAVYLIGLLPPNEEDAVRVNAATEHGHRSAALRRTDRSIGGGEVCQ